MITFENEFHNTRYLSLKHAGDLLSRRQAERIARHLCGREGCLCETFTGRYYLRGRVEGDYRIIDRKEEQCQL